VCRMTSNQVKVFIWWWGMKFEFFSIFSDFFGAITIKIASF
jgi:hypothetical protein